MSNKKQNTPETEPAQAPKQLPAASFDTVDEMGGRVVVSCDFADLATIHIFDNGKLWGKGSLTNNMAFVSGAYALTGDYSLTAELKPTESN